MKTHYWRQWVFSMKLFPVFSRKNNLKHLNYWKGRSTSLKGIYTEHTLSYFDFRHMMFIASELSKPSLRGDFWDSLWCLTWIWDKTFSFKCSVHHQTNRLLFAVRLSCIKYSSCSVILQNSLRFCLYTWWLLNIT